MDENPVKWNDDPAWERYIRSYEAVIEGIAKKYCWQDTAMREDTMQEARMGLLTIFPHKINGHAEYKAGTMTEAEWQDRLSRYCRMVIRNRIVTYLKKHNWYYQRTKKIMDPETGEKVTVKAPELFIRLDDILHTGAVQIAEDGQLSPSNWHANFDEIDLGLFEEDYDEN